MAVRSSLRDFQTALSDEKEGYGPSANVRQVTQEGQHHAGSAAFTALALVDVLLGDDLPALSDTDVFVVDDLDEGPADCRPEGDLDDFDAAALDAVFLALCLGDPSRTLELLGQVIQPVVGFPVDGEELPELFGQLAHDSIFGFHFAPVEHLILRLGEADLLHQLR